MRYGYYGSRVNMKTHVWTKSMSLNLDIHRHLPENRGENPVPECWYRNPIGSCLVPGYTQAGTGIGWCQIA